MKTIVEMFDVELLFKAFCFWIFLYSFFITLLEVSLYCVLIPLAIHFIVLHYSLRPHSEEIVKNIFGENPRTKLRESIDLDHGNLSELNASFSIAHEAALLDFTSSSIEAIKLCSENGYKFIHLDVHVTSDNVAVVHRKSNLSPENNEHDFSKSIEECSSNELFAVSKNEMEERRNEVEKRKLCIIEKILPTIENLDVKVMFNIIHSSYYKTCDSVILTILNIYKKYPFLHKKSVICSTNPLILYKIRKHDPSIVVTLKWVEFSGQSITTISWLKNFRFSNTVQHLALDFADSCFWWFLNSFIYRVTGISAVILPKEIVTPKIIENWERKNIRCIVGVVNLTMEKFYYANALGVAYLTDTLIID